MRLMNELHLYCPARRKHKHYCKYGDSAGTFEPNILQRQFFALQPRQKWTTDITEFKAFGKKLYLSVILDMYNGEIINYTLTESASLASVQQLISQAIPLVFTTYYALCKSAVNRVTCLCLFGVSEFGLSFVYGYR